MVQHAVLAVRESRSFNPTKDVEYEVSCIDGIRWVHLEPELPTDETRPRKGGWEYLVVWKGLPRNRASWEPEENMHCPDLTSEWDKAKLTKKGMLDCIRRDTANTGNQDANESAGDELIKYCGALSSRDSPDVHSEMVHGLLEPYLFRCDAYKPTMGRFLTEEEKSRADSALLTF